VLCELRTKLGTADRDMRVAIGEQATLAKEGFISACFVRIPMPGTNLFGILGVDLPKTDVAFNVQMTQS
jgi:hypothetical protein